LETPEPLGPRKEGQSAAKLEAASNRTVRRMVLKILSFYEPGLGGMA
jgi:hypothetical protein